jgi:cereblon
LFAQVQILDEEMPLHIPRDAFGSLASLPVFHSGKYPRTAVPSPPNYGLSDDEIAFQASSDVDISEQSESDSGPEEERIIQRCAFHSENIVM